MDYSNISRDNRGVRGSEVLLAAESSSAFSHAAGSKEDSRVRDDVTRLRQLT